MAYGRLDVYWPDGKIESHLLEAPEVTVGRANDNTIVLETETISRHHFKISHAGNATYLSDLDSENGILIDGERLKNYEAHVLTTVEELQVGFLRLIYHPMDDNLTVPVKYGQEETQRLMNNNTELGVVIDYREIKVWPASSASVEIAITNRTRETWRYALKLSGVPAEWIRINRPELDVSANETAYVLVNFKPARRSDVKPADYTALVEVVPKHAPEKTVKTELLVRLRGFSGFGMALSQSSIELDDPLSLYLHNQGSEDLTMVFNTLSKNNAVQVRFSMPKVTLSAGARSQVRLDVRPSKRPLFGKPETHSFFVVAQAQNAAHFTAPAECQVTVTPRLPMWSLITAVSVSIALVLALIVGLLGLLRPPANPTLTELSVNAERIAQGDMLELRWQASDAQRIEVSVNSQLVQELPGTARQLSLDTSAYNGNILVDVRAINDTQVAEDVLTVQVYVPMVVEFFNVSPTVLVRNVVTALDIQWNVPGAVDIELRGLENFTTSPLPDTLNAEGRLDSIVGYPVGELTITIFARDEAGNTLQQDLILPVTDPTCIANGDVPLYQGPDTRFQPISTAPANSTLIVLAKDASSGWLRVQLNESISAWGEQTRFTCAGNFALGDLRTEITPALPTGTPAPATALPTVSPTTRSVTIVPITASPQPSPTPRP
jgi:hypothetical protein